MGKLETLDAIISNLDRLDKLLCQAERKSENHTYTENRNFAGQNDGANQTAR